MSRWQFRWFSLPPEYKYVLWSTLWSQSETKLNRTEALCSCFIFSTLNALLNMPTVHYYVMEKKKKAWFLPEARHPYNLPACGSLSAAGPHHFWGFECGATWEAHTVRLVKTTESGKGQNKSSSGFTVDQKAGQESRLSIPDSKRG